MYKNAKVIVLANGNCPLDLRQRCGVGKIADVRLGGLPMVDHVVGAFNEAGFTDIITVGTIVQNCQYTAGGSSFMESFRAGFQALGDSFTGMILVAACDMPFVTASEIREFATAKNLGSALCCATVRMDACRERFPDISRTRLTLAEGEFTLGNVFAGERWVWDDVTPTVERAYNARKNKLALAWMLGLTTTVRYLRAASKPSALSIEQLERRAKKIVGCPVRAIIGDWAGIGTDIDTLKHYEAALKHFEPVRVPA